MNVPTRAAGYLTAARPIWALVLVGALRVGLVPAARTSADRIPSLEALLAAAAAADGFVLGGSGNAARFGFRNLPSEAWHWSPSGRCHPHHQPLTTHAS